MIVNFFHEKLYRRVDKFTISGTTTKIDSRMTKFLRNNQDVYIFIISKFLRCATSR